MSTSSQGQGRPLREGPVQQQSKSALKGIKKRWLELIRRPDTGLLCLNVYHTPEKAKIKVQLAVDKDFKVVAAPQDHSKEFSFTVVANNKNFLFIAETDASRKSWVAKLVEASHTGGNLFSVIPVDVDVPSDQVSAVLLDISQSHVALLEPNSRQVEKMFDLHHILSFGHQGDRVTMWIQLCTKPTCSTKGPEEIYLRTDTNNVDKIIESLTEALESAIGDQAVEEQQMQRHRSFSVLHLCVRRTFSRSRLDRFSTSVPVATKAFGRESQPESPKRSHSQSRKSKQSLKAAQQGDWGLVCRYSDDSLPYQEAGGMSPKLNTKGSRPLPMPPSTTQDPYMVTEEIFEENLRTPDRDSGNFSGSGQTSNHSSSNSGSSSGGVHVRLPYLPGRPFPQAPVSTGTNSPTLPARNSPRNTPALPRPLSIDSPTAVHVPPPSSPRSPNKCLSGVLTDTSSPAQHNRSPSSPHRSTKRAVLPPPQRQSTATEDFPPPPPPSTPPPPEPSTKSRLPSGNSPMQQHRLPTPTAHQSRSSRLPPANSPRSSRLPPSSLKAP